MSIINRMIGASPATTNQMYRYKPEPRNRSGFGRALQDVGSALVGTAGTLGGIDPTYTALLTEQLRIQQQMQLVSFQSNIEKSRHETQMSAIRNIRVG